MDFRLTGRVNGSTRFSLSARLAGSAPTMSLKVISEDFTSLYDSSGCCSEQNGKVEEGGVALPGKDMGGAVVGWSEGEHDGIEIPYPTDSSKEVNT